MTTSLWIYECPPQDWWFGSVDLFTYFNDLDPASQNEALEDFTASVCAIAKDTSWEGDGMWRVIGIPVGDVTPATCFAVKQSNNGTTYFASMVQLPWLDARSDVIASRVEA